MSGARKWTLLAVGIASAALFVRLGFWQLSRHGERARANDLRESRTALPRLDWSEARAAIGAPDPDTAGLAWRRVRIAGRYDREREIILRGRTHEGRPGVEVLTPLRTPGGDVLVLRGWLPAADGLRADLSIGWPPGWSDTTRVTVEGVLIPSARGRAGEPITVETESGEHLALAGADVALAEDRLPYDLFPLFIRAERAGTGDFELPPPRAIVTGSGPHLAYAIQWFAFAAIALIGPWLLLRRGRDARAGGSTRRQGYAST